MKDGDGMGSGSQRSRACARDPLIIDTPAGTNASNPYQVHVCMVQVNMSVASAALVDLPSRPRQQAPGWESQQPVGTKTPKSNVSSYSSISPKVWSTHPGPVYHRLLPQDGVILYSAALAEKTQSCQNRLSGCQNTFPYTRQKL